MADSASSATGATGNQCDGCKKTESKDLSLKKCNRCKSASYCSRECQKSNWKAHKKFCVATAQANAAPSAPSTIQQNTAQANNRARRALDVDIEKPFHKIYDRTWLHGRSRRDVYKLLIDTYRLRMDDNFTITGEIDVDSIYGEATDGGKSGFRRFLQMVEQDQGVLPEWWSPAHANACVQSGSNNTGWSNLAARIEKHRIMQYYGNSLMPMQLRMFSEQVYGAGPGGQRATILLQMQMLVEDGRIFAAHTNQ